VYDHAAWVDLLCIQPWEEYIMSSAMLRCFGFVCAFICVARAAAGVVVYNMSVEFSGATPPTGTPPWMTATFDDGGGMGSVMVTLDNHGLVGGEFVSNWAFNLDPSLDPSMLIASGLVASSGDGFTLPTISTGANHYMADGDGLYDIRFSFSLGGGSAARFGAGEKLTLTFSGIPTLTASSFNFLSFPAGGNGPFFTAAHVQGIDPGGDNSGWLTIPEPTSAAASMLSLVLVGGYYARRKRRQ
jgi:hypothetical protein